MAANRTGRGNGCLGLEYLRSGVVNYPPGARLGIRTMPDFEVVWIQRGSAVYHVNATDVAVGPGSIILSRPGFIEGYTWDPRQPTRHAYFHFNFREAPPDWPPVAQWPVTRTMADGDVIRPLIEFVIANVPDGHERRPGTTLCRAVETLLSAYLLGPLGRREPDVAHYPDPVHRALEYAGRRLAEEPGAAIALDDLAGAAMVSAKHLCRVFARHVSTSPMEAVMAMRLRHAAHLLARTDLKLEVIARHCGFATAYHLSRRFNDAFGRRPSDYRAAAAAGRIELPAQLRFGGGLAVEY